MPSISLVSDTTGLGKPPSPGRTKPGQASNALDPGQTGWQAAEAETVTFASDFLGIKKPLIFKGFRAFAACERVWPKLNSTHRKDATATAKGFADGQRMEPQPKPDGSTPPFS
jgi:hypothetical protein